MSVRITLTLIIFIVIGCTSSEDKTMEKVSLKIVPHSYSPSSGYCIKDDDEIHIVLSNFSRENIRIWKQWNSWGYYNLSFKLLTSNKEFYLTKKKKRWTRNFADLAYVKSFEHFVITETINSEYWDGIPLDIKGKKVKIKAIYETKETEEAKEHNIWTGKIESDYYEVQFL